MAHFLLIRTITRRWKMCQYIFEHQWLDIMNMCFNSLFYSVNDQHKSRLVPTITNANVATHSTSGPLDLTAQTMIGDGTKAAQIWTLYCWDKILFIAFVSRSRHVAVVHVLDKTPKKKVCVFSHFPKWTLFSF